MGVRAFVQQRGKAFTKNSSSEENSHGAVLKKKIFITMVTGGRTFDSSLSCLKHYDFIDASEQEDKDN